MSDWTIPKELLTNSVTKHINNLSWIQEHRKKFQKTNWDEFIQMFTKALETGIFPKEISLLKLTEEQIKSVENQCLSAGLSVRYINDNDGPVSCYDKIVLTYNPNLTQVVASGCSSNPNLTKN